MLRFPRTETPRLVIAGHYTMNHIKNVSADFKLADDESKKSRLISPHCVVRSVARCRVLARSLR